MQQKNSPTALPEAGNNAIHPNRRSSDSVSETFAEIFNDPLLSHDEKLERYEALWIGVEEIHLGDADPLPDLQADMLKRADASMSRIQSRMADLMPYEYDVIELEYFQEKDVLHLFFDKVLRSGEEGEEDMHIRIEMFLLVEQIRGDRIFGSIVFETGDCRYSARANLALPIFSEWRRKLDIRFPQTVACDTIPSSVSVLLHEYYMKRCIIHQRQSYRATRGIVGLIKSIIHL